MSWHITANTVGVFPSTVQLPYTLLWCLLFSFICLCALAALIRSVGRGISLFIPGIVYQHTCKTQTFISRLYSKHFNTVSTVPALRYYSVFILLKGFCISQDGENGWHLLLGTSKLHSCCRKISIFIDLCMIYSLVLLFYFFLLGNLSPPAAKFPGFGKLAFYRQLLPFTFYCVSNQHSKSSTILCCCSSQVPCLLTHLLR